MKRLIIIALSFALTLNAAAAQKNYELVSPDGRIVVTIMAGDELSYTLAHDGDMLLDKTVIGMKMTDGTEFGKGDGVRKKMTKSISHKINAPYYKKSEVSDEYNELSLTFSEFTLQFRAYDAGVAYRFVSNLKGAHEVRSESAGFNFAKDWNMWAGYVFKKTQPLETQYFSSFENQYAYSALSAWDKNRLAFLPLMVDGPDGRKIVIAESGLTDYPGMYLYNGDADSDLEARFAPYPKELKQGGHNMLQMLVSEREEYIAKFEGTTAFPWRIVSVSDRDVEMADNDLVWLLAEPADKDIDWSWVKPGKVAWEWWNAWNLRNVDFKTGVNNETYKYYIDFASEYGIEYVILDEGWAVNLQADLFQVVPEINLPELVAYAEERNVGLILWAGYWAFDRNMESVCRHYSEMGIKGFKVDFMDRDDQIMVDFHHRAAKMAAKYKMLLDFHGTYKPVGLNRTYPNVLNYEGVFGLEQMKGAPVSCDQVTYDVTVPYIRMMAGPMDYTQGAMRNGTKSNYRPVNTEPMSQGTRCRQLAEYVVFDSPLNMLCDTPSNYMQEAECTEFIAEIPTVWDETYGIDGKVGEYIAMARRTSDTWYVGVMTDWNARVMELDLTFLPEGEYEVVVFKDGVNADRTARDYRKEIITLPSSRKLTVTMAPGGGFAAKIVRR